MNPLNFFSSLGHMGEHPVLPKAPSQLSKHLQSWESSLWTELTNACNSGDWGEWGLLGVINSNATAHSQMPLGQLPSTMVLKLWQLSESPEGLIKTQGAWFHPQGFWIRRSRLGPENLISQNFPGAAEAARVKYGDDIFEDLWSRGPNCLSDE